MKPSITSGQNHLGERGSYKALVLTHAMGRPLQKEGMLLLINNNPVCTLLCSTKLYP